MQKSKIAALVAAWCAAVPSIDAAAVEAADEARGRVYAVAGEGLEVRDARTGARIASLALQDWFVVRPEYACPPAIALGPKGAVVVTSNAMATVWRVDPESLRVTRHRLLRDADLGRDFGFTRLRWSPESQAYVATADDGARWEIEASLTRAWKRGDAEGRRMQACRP